MFLDEIGEIAPSLQPKLLRVLQEQEFERLGGKSHDPGKFPIDRSQQPRSSGGGKCESISRRLILPAGGFPIELPALRHRQRDIPKLVHHLVAEIARRAGKTITSVPKKTMDGLMSLHWPGNVRELENFLERSAILTNGTVLAAPISELVQPHASPEKSDGTTLVSIDRQHILKALKDSNGQISGPRGAAARLGLKRTTLQSKLKKLGIRRATPLSETYAESGSADSRCEVGRVAPGVGAKGGTRTPMGFPARS